MIHADKKSNCGADYRVFQTSYNLAARCLAAPDNATPVMDFRISWIWFRLTGMAISSGNMIRMSWFMIRTTRRARSPGNIMTFNAQAILLAIMSQARIPALIMGTHYFWFTRTLKTRRFPMFRYSMTAL